ncbi:hypothetical protein DM02DRAFT_603094 [Periconia macrospinosa]|uniref:Uncharacterized protein n=1 Tax=Periconia macrospinosa TaxID=97972 RepID=A0A2V1D7D7_9PLEO|nr:hypothetical protein DM02DRAFT_603094 [Periconia macrospinosa]
MSVAHRPDFLAFRKETEREREAGTKFRDAFMYPYINLEDLSKPKALLLMLQSRSRNAPDVFAFADYDAVHLGVVSKAIVPPFLNKHTIMLTGRTTPTSYGALVSWDENDSAFMDMVSGKAMHPGQGLLVLEIQERLMRFLVDSCKRILHDVPASDLTSDKWPVQPPVVLPQETIDGFASQAAMAAEAPYRHPANMDLPRLESLFEAKRSAAEDHIWALREDPGYFAGAVLDYRDQRQETLKDTNGRSHPLMSVGREDIFWQRVIGNVLATAYLSLEVWSELHTQVKELRTLQGRYEHQITADAELPEEYLNALLRFRHYLNQASKDPIGQLKHCAYSSPPLRHLFVRIPPVDPSTPMIQVTRKPGVKLEKLETELIWLLQTLIEDGSTLFLVGLTNVVDELERLIQSDPKAKALISSHVADVFSDLSVISEALRQLKIYQPWAQTFEHALVDKQEGIEKEFAQHTQAWGLVMSAIDGPNRKDIVRLGEPTAGRFDYPVDKHRKQANVDAMRSAEQNLDAFWRAVDESMSGREIGDTALWRLLSQEKTLHRTPEWWVEPEKTAKQDLEHSITIPLSQLYFDLERRTQRTIDDTPSRTKALKPKTRGASTAAPDLPEPILTPTQPDIQPTFRLDARALKVFRTLFYTPTLNATPGEVSWTDFLHAMAATGFAPEKLYGSVWQFSPSGLDVERSIQFHEPHPTGKLSYRVVRRYGRRLNRAYGWEGKMFLPK